MSVNYLPLDEMMSKVCPKQLRLTAEGWNGNCLGTVCYACTPTSTVEGWLEYYSQRDYLDDEFRWEREDNQRGTLKHSADWYKEHGWTFVGCQSRITRGAHYLEPPAEALKRKPYYCSAMPGAAGGE